MKFPCLVDERFCRTPVQIIIAQEGVDKYGEPLSNVTIEKNCNWQDKGKTIMTAEKKVIQLTGCALIPRDIAPEMANITGGYVIVNDMKRTLYEGAKVRNPDGSVNFTRLDVI